ncbi:MAG: hypothetical protein ACOC7J_06245 [Armatimonadota bacterium]
MISPADIFCLAIIAGLMVLEGHRGIVPALVDFVCVLVGLILTRLAYVPLSEYADYMQPSLAYMVLFGLTIVLTATLSIFISSRLHVNVTPTEAAVGAALGLGAAVVVSSAFLDWLIIRYGSGHPLARHSVLLWAMTESAGVREVADFFRRLTGK